MDCKVKVTNEGGKPRLVIDMPFDPLGVASKTGKTMLHTSTAGAHESDMLIKTKVGEQALIINLNAYTYAQKKGEASEAEAPVGKKAKA